LSQSGVSHSLARLRENGWTTNYSSDQPVELAKPHRAALAMAPLVATPSSLGNRRVELPKFEPRQFDQEIHDRRE